MSRSIARENREVALSARKEEEEETQAA